MLLYTDSQLCRWYRKTWQIKRYLSQRAPLLKLLEDVLFCLAVILWPSPTYLNSEVTNTWETEFSYKCCHWPVEVAAARYWCHLQPLGSVSARSPHSSSIYAALASQRCLCKGGVPLFRLTLPTMVMPAHLKSGNPKKQYEEIFFFLLSFRTPGK